MKNNSTLTWLFRPFTFVAGTKALIYGIIVLLILSIMGYLSNTHFDGIIDIHLGEQNASTPYILHAFYQLSTWLILTIIFYITARITSKSETRLIDIAGTMALSQVPLIFASLTGFMSLFHISLGDINTMTIGAMTDALKENIIPLMIGAVVFMVFSIWSVILKYNAYSVSSNLKGPKAWISFGLALFVCEVISKIVIYLIAPSLY